MNEVDEAELGFKGVEGEESEFDTVSAEIGEAGGATEDSKSAIEDILPDEFKDKTALEIAKEALFYRGQMGRQANELGEVRKLADELIKSQLAQKPKPEIEQSDEIDIFDNPKEAVRRAIEANPVVQSIALQAENARRTLAKNTLMNLHPDAETIIQDPKFNNWVNSSRIRQQLLQQADQYDVDAANELFSTYKAIQNAQQRGVSDVEKSARDKAIRAAGVDTGGTGEKSKKIYSRAQIMKLMTTDRWRSDTRLQDEITNAYAENRVR